MQHINEVKVPSGPSVPAGAVSATTPSPPTGKSVDLNAPLNLDGQFRPIANEDSKEGIAVPMTKFARVKDKAELLLIKALDKLGSNPDQQKGAIKNLVTALPGIGPSIAYAEAWKLWHRGNAMKDEILMQEARAKCLVAIGYAGIEVLLLSTKAIHSVAKVGGAAKFAQKLISPLLKLQAVKAFTHNKKGQVNSVIQALATRESAKSVAEYLLQRVSPQTSESALKQSAASIAKDLEKIVDRTKA